MTLAHAAAEKNIRSVVYKVRDGPPHFAEARPYRFLILKIPIRGPSLYSVPLLRPSTPSTQAYQSL
jgi:hypothetical protein